jgi:hypothetical protein
MLALPLLLALAVTADPPPAPEAPAAAEEAEGPGYHVAPPEAPGFEEPAPVVPFTLEGFQAPELTVVGAAGRAGFSDRGFDGGLDVTLRKKGFIGGAAVGGVVSGQDTLRTLGLSAGYGATRGKYRYEGLLGWGVVSDRVDEGILTTTRVGHYRSLQVAVDRALCGGHGWRAFGGLALWVRNTIGLPDSKYATTAVGGGLHLGLEAGW